MDWLGPLRKDTERIREETKKIREETNRLREENKELKSISKDELKEIFQKSLKTNLSNVQPMPLPTEQFFNKNYQQTNEKL